MTANETDTTPKLSSREKLLLAAIKLVRERGFAATSVEDLCRAAGVTKGSFFHHFATKEELGIVATHRWGALASEIFAAIPWRDPVDPVDRILAYLELRRSLLVGEIAEFTCFAGTLVQEAHSTSDAIRRACDEIITDGARIIEADLVEAFRAHGLGDEDDATSLALHVQAVIQGALVMAKAKGTADVAIGSVDHLRRYIELLFSRNDTEFRAEVDQP
ncbi:TetR/AcrR family transcriptional regulator [Oceaniovalibus sp. ACAM 378]|uniref:TetR/AcrR family transcriptional regulator n=1 Tax=Oceaniovalibus sp. ACAM 378 TaxID=2599923 RepID=UPI0011D32F48|nr:TetR/AcrR family transcriptional regulator [Oceaniovalibus sp. ACAM 378]TYB86065.1 TetR/AcrR family transcriptional regulator [Oceaniovalibus sp. ACAM 378]